MSKLEDKAIKIQGKDYVLVSDRVIYFNETYPNWSIQTEIVRYEEKQIMIKAIVYPDVDKPARFFTWYSQEIEWSTFINKTSALENAETSAVGRALWMMWIWVIQSIASADEINKAKNRSVSKETITDQDIDTVFWQEKSCSECWCFIDDKVAQFSMSKFKKYLCREHQK